MATPANGDTPSTDPTSATNVAGSLQKELNQANVKHREELYWLRLELDTTRREKEAVEDRMAELYRDLQEMQESKSVKPKPANMDAAHVTQLQTRLENFERMVRVMNSQLTLVRNSSDTVVKSLKEEISDIMDEKTKMELNLMNQVADMEKDRQELRMQVQVQAQRPDGARSSAAVIEPNGSAGSDNDDNQLQAQVALLQAENTKLTKALSRQSKEASEKAAVVKQEKDALTRQVDKLHDAMLSTTRSPEQAIMALDQMKLDRNETMYTLERVSLLWDRADESIQRMERVLMELKPRDDQVEDDESEHLLSTLETASLVNGQIKVSLMLVELKLRNNLACIKNDQLQLGSLSPADPAVSQRMLEIEMQAMAAIAEVQESLDSQIRQLDKQSVVETDYVKETMESKVTDLERMEALQHRLEQEITVLHTQESGEHHVSQKALEQLQGEVLQVIERVKEKNESIGRLTATVEEHKVRERSLMEELKRLMKDQSEHEFAERQRRVDSEMLRVDDEDDDDDEDEDGSYCDDSTAYVERSIIE